MPIQPANPNVQPPSPEGRVIPPMQYFDEKEYNDVILLQGYDVLWQRGQKCACSSNPQNAAFNNCFACDGVGWFWEPAVETKMMISHQDRKKQFNQTGEYNLGTAFISSYNNQTLQYADMVTNTLSQTRFSENVRAIFGDNGWFARTTYKVLSLEAVWLYLPELATQTNIVSDCTFDQNKIILGPKYTGLNNVQISVTYTHNPQYFVVDSNRQVVNLQNEVFGERVLQQMPTNAMARLLQYVLPAPS